MPLPPIVDPHIHLWSPRSTPRKTTPVARLFGWSRRLTRASAYLFPRDARDFVGFVDHVASDFLPETYRSDAGGLDIRGVVHIEASWIAKRPMDVVDETRWLEGLDGDELILGIVGAADLASPELDAQLDGHASESPRFRGIRDKLACDPHPGVMDWNPDSNALRNPAWQRGYARLGERGLSFDAWLYAPQLRDFHAVARAHPETAVVLDHIGTPLGIGGPFGRLTDAERADIEARWRDDLAAVAELPHVHVKLSGLTMPTGGFGLFSGPPIDADALAELLGPHYRFVIELFGTERCMFASNFPMDKVSTSLETLYAAFDRIAAGFSDEERKALFAGNAERFYRL